MIAIVPTAEMTVETTKPHRRLKPPLAETLAISVALVISLSRLLLAYKLTVAVKYCLSLLVSAWQNQQ